MNWTLYRDGMKRSWKPLVIFAGVLTMYVTVIITMFDPNIGSALKEIENLMPELMAMVGMTTEDSTLVGFLAGYLYGFVMLVFPMVYTIIVANGLVAKRVDTGAMACLLAAPVSRRRIVFTQAKVLGTGVVAIVAFATAVAMATCQVCFPGQLDVKAFLLMNLGVFALQLCISGICFLASCIFNEAKYSLAFGAGIPALAYILQMVANAGEKLEATKYATFFTLFDPKGILAGEAWAFWGMGILGAAAVVLYVAAGAVFVKKDIPV